MKLRVHEIQDAGVVETQGRIDSKGLILGGPDGARVGEDVKVKIRAEAVNGEILVLAEVRARVRLNCSRCLESFEMDVPASFDMRVSLRETFVDVGDDARQALILALPVKPLCRPDCGGLCSQCGVNLNGEKCGCSNNGPNSPFTKLKDFYTS